MASASPSDGDRTCRGTAASRPATVVVLMGVSGCGKTTVGRHLAPLLAAGFLDADDLHPEANVRSMRGGTPLTEVDRSAWLDAVADVMARSSAAGRDLVVACSALTRNSRDRLRIAVPSLRLVHLDGPEPVIRRRLERRTGHFMPAVLLGSQFATLEPPGPDERPLFVGLSAPPDELAARIAAAVAGHDAGSGSTPA